MGSVEKKREFLPKNVGESPTFFPFFHASDAAPPVVMELRFVAF